MANIENDFTSYAYQFPKGTNTFIFRHVNATIQNVTIINIPIRLDRYSYIFLTHYPMKWHIIYLSQNLPAYLLKHVKLSQKWYLFYVDYGECVLKTRDNSRHNT